MTAILPSQSSLISLHWIRAGMFMLRARMAVWLLALPSRVTKPSSRLLSSRTVSEGARSSATRMEGSVPCMLSTSVPCRMSSMAWAMSMTSALRAWR